jgi:hypothetical protein
MCLTADSDQSFQNFPITPFPSPLCGPEWTHIRIFEYLNVSIFEHLQIAAGAPFENLQPGVNGPALKMVEQLLLSCVGDGGIAPISKAN